MTSLPRLTASGVPPDRAIRSTVASSSGAAATTRCAGSPLGSPLRTSLPSASTAPLIRVSALNGRSLSIAPAAEASAYAAFGER